VFLPSGQDLSGLFVSRGSLSSWKIVKLSWCFRTVLAAKRSVAVGLVSEPENCHDCRNFIASSARNLVQLSFLNCLGSRNLFAKTATSQLTFIVRVMVRITLIINLDSELTEILPIEDIK
jgi:hypothetical protein